MKFTQYRHTILLMSYGNIGLLQDVKAVGDTNVLIKYFPHLLITTIKEEFSFIIDLLNSNIKQNNDDLYTSSTVRHWVRKVQWC